jgi:dolichol kinase
LLYPMAILTLVLVFPTRLDLVATVWAILAVGDGMATLVGIHAPIAPLPWNHKKSLGGLGAFVLFGSVAAAGMMWWSSPDLPDAWMFGPIMAAVLAGFAETVPVTLDDNVTVPAVAATVLWSTAGMSPALLFEHSTTLDAASWSLLAINAGVATVGWAVRGLMTR